MPMLGPGDVSQIRDTGQRSRRSLAGLRNRVPVVAAVSAFWETDLSGWFGKPVEDLGC